MRADRPPARTRPDPCRGALRGCAATNRRPPATPGRRRRRPRMQAARPPTRTLTPSSRVRVEATGFVALQAWPETNAPAPSDPDEDPRLSTEPRAALHRATRPGP